MLHKRQDAVVSLEPYANSRYACPSVKTTVRFADQLSETEDVINGQLMECYGNFNGLGEFLARDVRAEREKHLLVRITNVGRHQIKLKPVEFLEFSDRSSSYARKLNARLEPIVYVSPSDTTIELRKHPRLEPLELSSPSRPLVDFTMVRTLTEATQPVTADVRVLQAEDDRLVWTAINITIDCYSSPKSTLSPPIVNHD